MCKDNKIVLEKKSIGIRVLQNRGKVGKIRVESLREIATNFSFDHLENDILNCMQDWQYYEMEHTLKLSK